MKKFLSLFFLLSVLFSASASSNFFYKVTANAVKEDNTTGGGLVYARADTERGPWLFKEAVSSRLYVKSSQGDEASFDGKVYLDAIPHDGYALDYWSNATTGERVTSGSTTTFKSTSKDIRTPTSNVFTAHFVETNVSVFSANNDLCAVSIDPAINSAGQTVKLSATPKTGAKFLGWRKKGTATILSTQQSNYEVTATSGKTTYEAVFRYVGTQKSFVRMQSQSETSKYLSLIQDNFSYTAVMTTSGGYSGLTDTTGVGKRKALEKAGEFLSQDISLGESVYDPGQIIVHENNNFFAQGTNVGFITEGYSCHHVGYTEKYGIVIQNVDLTKLKIDAQKIKYIEPGIVSMNPSVVYEGNTYELGNIYIINENGAISVTQTLGTTDNYHWNKVPINGNNQYFAFNPEIRDSKTGKYYTTLRTSFSYKIKNPDKVTAYEINEVADGGTIMTPFGPDEVIPGDLAVVLESTSQEPTDNILLPYDLEYTKANTVLFNKYGHRLHCYTGASNSSDQYDSCTEGGIGYFKVAYNAANMGNMYKLSVNANGEVGFWTKVAAGETVSGNEGYSTVQCGLFKYADLKDIPETAGQFTYHITNPLTVAYVDKNNTIYAKDNNGIEPTPGAGEINFMEIHYPNGIYGKHYNWVAIEPGVLPALQPGDSRIEASGKVLESTPNRRIKATVKHLDDNGTFDPNTYCIVNFMDKSYHKIGNTNFFFAAPEANEIAEIIWAQWDGNNTFIVPPRSGFSGAIAMDHSLYNGDLLSELQGKEGHEFRFIGLIEKLASSKDATSPKDATDVSDLYKVYPLYGLQDMTGDNPVTGVDNVTLGDITSVKYYNTMGVESNVPFRGVNIMVTNYSDGSRKVTKVMR